MNTTRNLKRSRGAGAVVLFATAATILLTTGMPAANHAVASEPTADSLAIPADDSEVSDRVWLRCPECGIVQSKRLIQNADDRPDQSTLDTAGSGRQPEASRNSRKLSEITVRMADGASQHFIDSNPDNWHLGERVMFLKGVDDSNQ